jgi:hypothetical protein
LITVTLAALVSIFLAEFLCHATKAELAAADVEWAFLVGRKGKFATLGMGVAIAPAFIIGGFAVCSAGGRSITWSDLVQQPVLEPLRRH